MSKSSPDPAAAPPSKDGEFIEIDLKNRYLAAFLAWIWPGSGHLYQGRYAKGVLFMVCILSTYFFGLAIGGGHVVYASSLMSGPDRRWQYVCQLGVGAPALPALEQYRRATSRKNQPLLLGNERRLMAPPENVVPESHDMLAEWHDKYHGFFELGTLYTMIAGLLNVLAIFDAYAGPMMPHEEERTADDEADAKSRRKRRKGGGDAKE